MEYNGNFFRALESFLLLFSMILQIICLAAPGWLTRLGKYSDSYVGIFYRTRCTHLSQDGEECKTESWHDQYKEALLTASEDYRPGLDYTYHLRVRYQIMLLVSFALTTVCLGLQTSKNRHKNLRSMVLVKAATMSFLVFAGTLLISYLSEVYIEIDYYVSLDKQSGDDDSLGFPYCILLATIAFLSILSTIIVENIEIRKVLREYVDPGQSIPWETPVMSRLDNSGSTETATGGHVNSGGAYIVNK